MHKMEQEMRSTAFLSPQDGLQPAQPSKGQRRSSTWRTELVGTPRSRSDQPRGRIGALRLYKQQGTVLAAASIGGYNMQQPADAGGCASLPWAVSAEVADLMRLLPAGTYQFGSMSPYGSSITASVCTHASQQTMVAHSRVNTA